MKSISLMLDIILFWEINHCINQDIYGRLVFHAVYTMLTVLYYGYPIFYCHITENMNEYRATYCCKSINHK